MSPVHPIREAGPAAALRRGLVENASFGLSVCAVTCFASVVMAWYGVNFVLGAGLHSYGFGGGNDAWVYWGALINISLVLHAALRYHHWQPALSEQA